MMEADPREQAIKKFAAPASLEGMDRILRYATDPPIAVATLLASILERVPDDGRVAELGFGPGWLLEELLPRTPAELHGLDMSAAAISTVHEMLGSRVRLARGDIERLPYGTGVFDAIATCWTLYFIRDIDAALEEIKRCVRPRGRVIAATVAPDHMMEYDTLVAESVRAALGRERDPDVSVRFDLSTAEAYMRRHFDSVELREWHGEMTLPDADIALEMWRGYGPQLQDPDEDAAARAVFGSRVRAVIAREGAFRMRRHDGLFVGFV